MTEQLRPGDPRRVGPYRLTGRLGGGGMGEVFLGRSAGGRPVAVKVIRPELASDHEFRTRFRREVAAARRVSGLYTATVAGADTEGAVPWLATEYLPGPSLEVAVGRHGALPAPSVLALAAGLAEGLGAVHAAGLVHRDIKPSNVLLERDGPRLIDFGVAWDAQSTVLTQAGTIFGSPAYVSPEYAVGDEYGTPSDVFSLGAVLAYAATGRPPFAGESPATVINRIVVDAPDLDGVPPEARPVIQWCLAKDPAARPTPAELVAQLGDALLGDPWLPEELLAEESPADLPGAGASPKQAQRRPDRDTQTIAGPAAPKAAAKPKPAVPKAAVPDLAAPRPISPDPAAPDPPVPDPSAPKTPAPDPLAPDPLAPDPLAPDPASPEPGMPEQGVPESRKPESRKPAVTVPKPAAPKPAAPESAAPESAGIVLAGIQSAGIQSAGIEPGSDHGHSRPAPRKIAGIVLPASAPVAVAFLAVVFLAAAGTGAGLWLGLGHRGGTPHPTSTSTPTPTPTQSRTATATATGSAVLAKSPYRFVLSGAVERPCGSAIRSASGGRAASIVFADKIASTIQVFWVDYQGSKSPAVHVSLKPGASGEIRGGVGDAWQLDGPHGCLGEFITAAAARVTVERA